MGNKIGNFDYWTEKERRWLQSYVRSGNAARAVREAGYDVDESAVNMQTVMGAQIKKKPHIKAALQAIEEQAARRYEVTVERLVDELASMAFSNVADYYDIDEKGQPRLNLAKASRRQLSAIHNITIKDTEFGPEVKMALHSKTQAIELLGRNKKMFVDRVEHSVHVDIAERIKDARSRIARLPEPVLLDGHENAGEGAG